MSDEERHSKALEIELISDRNKKLAKKQRTASVSMMKSSSESIIRCSRSARSSSAHRPS